MGDYGIQKRAQGKAEMQARIAWLLDLRGVQFRCLRTAYDQGPKAFLVQIKKQGGSWNNTTSLGASPGDLFHEVVAASDALIKTLWG